MLRIRIEVSEVGNAWQVSPNVRDGTGQWVPVVTPYPMDRVVAPDGRSLPRPDPARLPQPADAHAVLCSGDTEPLTQLLGRLARRDPEAGDMQLYGRWLFESLLAPLWQAIDADAAYVNAPLELALSWSPTSPLNRLTWEAMHDGRAPVVSHPQHVVAITRLISSDHPQPAAIAGMPRVLFAIGAPLADPTIRPGAMYMGLLKALDASGRCRSKAIVNASLEDLDAACRRFVPHVVHIVAHGELAEDGRGTVLLRGEGGEWPADAAALYRALRADQGDGPIAVVISACNSGGGAIDDPTDIGPLAAQLVAAGIPIVSAVAGEIGERACRYYTRRLAESLHAGQPIVEAAAHGRRAAMMAAATPATDVDWALPALFLSEQIDPARPLIDKVGAERVVGLGDRLTLRRQPIFVGRQDILDVTDNLVDDGSEVRVVATVFDKGGEGYGATRLLREIGWRVLRDGHLPIVLGPFSTPPHTLRALVVSICTAALTAVEKMGLRVFVPSALRLALAAPVMAELRAEVNDQTVSDSEANAAVRQALRLFAEAVGPLDDAAAARGFLVDDLLEVATMAKSWGNPFGEHTRPVVLCDNVHEWAEPSTFAALDRLSALTGLLSMLDGSGLGGQDKPVPVVLSGSLTAAAGPTLRSWLQAANPWVRSMSLGDMSADEALVGFQWVLLHPWVSPDNPDTAFTYTPNPGQRAAWETVLGGVPRRPDSVKEMLYAMANVGHNLQFAARNNDETEWRSYASANGLE